MEKEIQRMQRIRTLLESIPRKKILKKKVAAIFSLDYGISIKTVDNYLQTLIDAEKIKLKNKKIWKV